MKTVIKSLSIVSLLVLLGCDATQPKPTCRSQQSRYGARYTVKGTPMGACEGKVLTGELLHLAFFRPKPDDANRTLSMGIEADSVVKAVAAAKMAMTPVMGQEFSQGRFQTYEPDDNDVCHTGEISEASITAGMTQLGYKWSNLQMLVKPLANATHFGADLTRKDGACTVEYSVSAAYPALYCGTGTKTEMNEMGMMVTVPDPTTGPPDHNKCKAVMGNGINPEFDLECDASADGKTGTHLCVPKKAFPSLK